MEHVSSLSGHGLGEVAWCCLAHVALPVGECWTGPVLATYHGARVSPSVCECPALGPPANEAHGNPGLVREVGGRASTCGSGLTAQQLNNAAPQQGCYLSAWVSPLTPMRRREDLNVVPSKGHFYPGSGLGRIGSWCFIFLGAPFLLLWAWDQVSKTLMYTTGGTSGLPGA